MSRSGSAGRGPRPTRRAPARDRRSRAPSPKRATPRPNTSAKARPHTALTPRAAVLALAAAFVIVAVALPFKIWLGQRGQINSLTAQTHDAQARVGKLTAQHQRWSDPTYVETQAHKRLHYIVPGKNYTVVLDGPSHKARTKTARTVTVSPDEAWYSQLWHSMQIAGAAPSHRK